MEDRTLEIMHDFVSQVNIINKRMVIAIIAVVACLCVFMSISVISYFYSDYDYGIVSQYQTDGNNQHQTITTGADNNG